MSLLHIFQVNAVEFIYCRLILVSAELIEDSIERFKKILIFGPGHRYLCFCLGGCPRMPFFAFLGTVSH